ncbi:hypothetical protein E4U36_005342 [Claviceps purpurea]|nr:hypothetical protein E4U36_005342 [Claviceps purpurea]
MKKVLNKMAFITLSRSATLSILADTRYVALKLLTNNCYGGSYEIFEREILEKIRDTIEFTHGSVMFRETPSKRGIWTLEDDHLAKIVEILGSIPPSLLMKGRRTAELLDEQGKFLRIPKLGLASLERVLNGDIMPLMKPPDMPDDEIDVFIDFVRGMLQIDPMARKSAAQLLQHEWLS